MKTIRHFLVIFLCVTLNVQMAQAQLALDKQQLPGGKAIAQGIQARIASNNREY